MFLYVNHLCFTTDVSLLLHASVSSPQDRYAVGRFLPPIDASQDWQLVNSGEENGATILEFTRKLVTCDDRDLDIKVCMRIIALLSSIVNS